MGRDDCKLDNPDVTEELNAKEVQDADILDTTLSYVGAMGRYQKLMFLAMMPFGIVFAFTFFSQIFITLTPQNYWCRIPELANLSTELRRNLSAPGAITGDWDHCMTFDTNWTHVLETLTPPPNGTNLVKCQHGWEFEFHDVPYETIVTERQWVCERANYVPTAQSMFGIGSMIGSLIFGCIADRFGRIPAIIGTNLISAVGGLATIFTTGFWDFIICRFFVGLSFDSCFSIAYILFLEYLGPKYRTLFGNLALAFAYGFGSATIAWLAYFIADWRTLQWVISLPGFLVLALAWFLPESISLFKSPPLLRAIISLMLLFMGESMVLDGLIRLSGSFGMSFFYVFTINAATEFTANFFVAVLLDRWGRRIVTGIPIIISGVALVATLFLDEGLPRVSLAVFARFLLVICFTSTFQWSTEILPTPVRASASSILHISLFVGVIISPFIIFTEYLWKMLPLMIFAAVAFLTAGITLTLPETKGLPMTQTLADGERIIREQSLCGKRVNADGMDNRWTRYKRKS